MKNISRWILLFLLVAAGFTRLQAQQKKTLTPDDYKKWERLSSTVISQDGQWIGYRISNEDRDTLYLVNIKTDSVFREAHGSGLAFSSDSKWAVFRIGVAPKKAKTMLEKKQPVHYRMGLIFLPTGERTVYKEVSSFRFPKEGACLAATLYPPKGSKAKGQDLIVMDLEKKNTRTIGHVSAYAFNRTGRWLAYIVQPGDGLGNGVELYDLRNRNIRILASDTVTFKKLAWAKKGDALAFMKQLKNKNFKEDNYELWTYRRLDKSSSPVRFNPEDDTTFTAGMRITPSGGITWSEDEETVFFGLQPWTPKKSSSEKKKSKKDSTGQQKTKKDEKLPGVDVWHWKDPYIQPRQKKTYTVDKNRSFLSMYDLEKKHFMQIADSTYPFTTLSGDQKNALINTRKPYQPQFRLTYADYLQVNLLTGARRDVLKHHTGYIVASPAGKYLLYFKDKQWWTYNLGSGEKVNITGSLGVAFWNTKDDHPAEVRPPFGYGGWMKDDRYVLLYDEYDVWACKPDGSSSMKLTSGRDGQNIYRVIRFDYEEKYLDPKQPLYFRVNGDKTKKSGLARLVWGKDPELLLFEDKMVSGIAKARMNGRFIFTDMTYEQPPVLYSTDGDFKQISEVVRSNKQQDQYAWGRAELISFTNKNGRQLQGVLHYPANYQEGKKYPMVVYIYEIRSNSLHYYINPSVTSSYNVTNYVQQGFFVFQPDIVYRLDDPGISAVECVVPAVEEVLKTGMVDRKKIGLMGHSWGAYQTAFIVTQTDLFSAAVAGAPLTDMISMYTEVYWNSGSPNQNIFETSQGRFTQPYWKIMDKYIANSPMFQAQNITAPILVTFGDQDGAVDWHQGIELYTTMRRMQKPMVLLVYAGENHGLRKEENRKDYTRRINEWFNHYLLGKPAPDWITKGVSYMEKVKKEEAQKGKK